MFQMREDVSFIYFKKSCSNIQQQNGVVKRKHRYLLEMTHAFFLLMPRFPPLFGTINRLPTPTLKDKPPYEVLFATVPDYEFLKTFGCDYFQNFMDTFANK